MAPFFFLPILLLMLSCFEASSSTNLTTDQLALLEFKSHITTFNKQNSLRYNWSTSDSVCYWIGVSCGILHERVIGLELPNMDLGGTVPPQVANLSFLTSLNLRGNHFHGQLPKELEGLHHLKFLDLSSNSLTGEIPLRFQYWSQLQHLNLCNNSFTGKIPTSIGNFTKLKEIYLGGNDLEGEIPPEVLNLSDLEVFSLRELWLTGPIPSAIFNITSLKEIDLQNNRLSGSIPDDMCQHLPNLKYLNLHYNQLYGELPSSIGKCSELWYLALSANKFTGGLPKTIANLTKLKEMYLGRNNLQGEIPLEIGNLMRLEIFEAQDLELSGPIPLTLINMSSLTVFEVQNNNLYGEIPLHIDNLNNLEKLSIGVNNLKGRVPLTIFNISTIKIIHAESNNFSGQLPSNIVNWVSNLEELYLSENQLSGAIPSFLFNATKLRILELRQNSFTGIIPNAFGNLRLLQRLIISNNNVTTKSFGQGDSNFLSSLSSCKQLEIIDVSYNPLNDIFLNSLGNLSVSLQRFHASYGMIRGYIPRELGNLRNLTLLNLSGNDLIGPIPNTIERLQDLHLLSLHNNHLNGSIPYEICRLKKLNHLALQHNNLHGQIPTCLSNLTFLLDLQLNSNKLSSTLPSALWSLSDIMIISLSSNFFTGSLSSEIGNLKRMSIFDASNNNLSGSLPSTMNTLQDLQHLSLANNILQGTIPESFGEMITLELLDLSNNIFSGVIPKSLEALKRLKKFNVSFNSLQGEIPREGPFKNFTSRSFLQNKDLCGLPQLQVPPCKSHNSKMSISALVLRYIFPLLASGLTILAVTFTVIFIRRRRQRSTSRSNQESILPMTEWRRISKLELQKATNGFSEGSLLGIGGFGSVYKGSLPDGIYVAIKVFNLELEGALRSFEVECEVIRNVRHRNLVKIISSSCDLEFMALILEFIPNGNLEKWLYSHNYFLNIFQRLNMLIDVASALEYLHHGHLRTIIHCDLKPSNVLLDNDMVAHVADFGIAKLLGEDVSLKQTLTLASVGYMAPEYGLMGIVSTQSDVYSFGILLMETFTRIKPTDEMFIGGWSLKHLVKGSLPDAITKIVDSNLLRKEGDMKARMNCISSILELALDCTSDSPNERGNMKDILVKLQNVRKKLLVQELNVKSS